MSTCTITTRRMGGFDLTDITSYGDLARHALQNIAEHDVRAMVSGPITTGGVASRGVTDPAQIQRQNLAIFDCAIRYTQALADCNGGSNVWDQMPYEEVIARLVEDEKSSPGYGGYPTRLLQEFYLPVFQGAGFSVVHMIPDWENSTGASWEKKVLEALGARVEFLPKDFLEDAARFEVYPPLLD